ncbi:FAD-dependent monooxygenase [Allokutzneria sp. A3M-2-11 16]|uniref:FAD-dependent oxidoreductase n=1 Tax=Allokutzneria sp. A3M-2-11 16 TaxID=2962043 RepID=UPI0020B8CD48|nr:NAD(P)/FAD-dependent oxidoreductase [Allokutzneria sp. A3M-2-11 16]MCP3805040.1 FAD-dependent monooxygenase [Allokutzneria sp. A3M-2-11 16]
MRMTMGSAAVVIGAGIAGLSAGRVLADRFERVVILDRDSLPGTASPRRGAGQSYHAHVLLAAGQRDLEELFPGLHDELVRAGATPFDAGARLAFHRYGVTWPPEPLGLHLVSMSRPLLELTLRRRVSALPNVTLRDEVSVAGVTNEGHRVTGVTLDDGEVLPADLVVDCSGRGSRSDRWLAPLGLPGPTALDVKIGVSYATRLYRRKPGDLADDALGLAVLPAPPEQTRAASVLPIEDDRWIVTLGGWHGDTAPTDDDGFLRFARELPHPGVADLIADAEPLTDIVPHQFPSSRWRQFHRVRELPAGYLAMGDTMCSFNPVYGQGITCAAMEALALGRALNRHSGVSADLARDYYRAAAKIIAVPWSFAVGADFGYPETSGPRPFGVDLLNAYSRRLQIAANSDVRVRRAFWKVQHLLAPPATLFAPSVMIKALRVRP